MATSDFLFYYDLENYLFDVVHKRFHDAGSLGAFDLMTIVIWKSNRAKSRIAKRLLSKSKLKNLEGAACQFTSKLAKAPTPEARLLVAMKDWELRLPMATAILTVLWPDDFTVFDYRVGEQFPEFMALGDVLPHKVWPRYAALLEAVRASGPPDRSLRDKDRALWAKSSATQLLRDIETRFERTEPTLENPG